MNKSVVISWILVLAVMLIIFGFSAQVAEDSSEISEGFIATIYRIYLKITGVPCSTGEFEASVQAMQNVVRKLAHFTLYSILGFLFSNAYMRTGFVKFFPLAVLSSALYAVTDEFHQLFVDGRSGELRDILIDSCGAFTGAFIFTIITFLWRKLWKKHSEI